MKSMKPGIYETTFYRTYLTHKFLYDFDALGDENYFRDFVNSNGLTKKKLTLVLPKSFCRLYNYFDGCDEIVFVGEQLTDYTYKFNECKNLMEVYLPDNLDYFDPVTNFLGSKSMINVRIDKDNDHFLTDGGILYSKDKTELIYQPPKNKSHISNSIKFIRKNALFERAPKKAVIPDSVILVQSNCFGPNVRSIVIPDNCNVYSTCCDFEHVKKIYCSKERQKEIIAIGLVRDNPNVEFYRIPSLDDLIKKGYTMEEINEEMKVFDERTDR